MQMRIESLVCFLFAFLFLPLTIIYISRLRVDCYHHQHQGHHYLQVLQIMTMQCTATTRNDRNDEQGASGGLKTRLRFEPRYLIFFLY